MTYKQIGWKELAAITGPQSKKSVEKIREISPLLAESLVEHAFGTLFTASPLPRRDQELVTISLLGAMGGAEPQLRTHLEAALRVGADPDELIALAEHLSVYACYPRALNLLRETRVILADKNLCTLKETRKVDLHDHDTRVFDSGGVKPVLVLIHALAMDWRMWREVIPNLSANFRVIAYDIRGFGCAAEAPSAAGLETYALDLSDLLNKLGVTQAHIAGLSLGGSIAQHLALKDPSRFHSLTIIAATAWPLEVFTQRADAAVLAGMDAQVIPSLTRWFRPEDLAENSWAVRYARNNVQRAFVSGWQAGWMALASIETGKRLNEITVPTHIVAGELDVSTPPELMKGFLAIPGASFEIIAGAPHMISLVYPHELAAAITRGTGLRQPALDIE
ncbi:MAG: alpha/beta fold hydrolase [Serratia inhibens]|uniref:alpha/beta fold hydrolase n=1 Tax=Serratia inhibens TaxID=2338073 RepID=UPI003C7C5A26